VVTFPVINLFFHAPVFCSSICSGGVGAPGGQMSRCQKGGVAGGEDEEKRMWEFLECSSWTRDKGSSRTLSE